jgi:hypothetical protein
VRKRKPKKKTKKGPTPVKIEYIGDKPQWEIISMKGDTCISTSSASVPCKDPLKVGKSCSDRHAWSDQGYIESEVFCLKDPKKKGWVLRKEMRKECFSKEGEFQCWKHWSQTGCHDAYCQSDKTGNGFVPYVPP